MPSHSPAPPRARLAGHLPTIVAISILVYILGDVLHEAVGHGGACLAVGGRPLTVSTVDMECSSGHRLVAAGGTLANFAAAALFFVLHRTAAARPPAWKYFFWLAMTLNLFAACGYFAFSGVGGFGDWSQFIQGFPAHWAWRIGMTLFGFAAYMMAVRFSLLQLRPLIGSDRHLRYLRAVELSRIPYFAGGILACLAGALNPAGLILVALSAAASTFGGASGLLWMMPWLKGSWIPLAAFPEPQPVPRSWGWIAAAALCAGLWVAVLGPGLRLSKPLPH